MAKQQGYLFIDHRASPGLPEDVARAAGYDPALCREGKVYRQESLTCRHCRGVVVKNPFRTRDRASCAKCGGEYICDACHFQSTLPDYVHTPFEKMVEDHRNWHERVKANSIATIAPPRLILP